MTEEDTLRRTLYEGTSLVKKVASEEIPFLEFLEKYDSFYHLHALDGHEMRGFSKKLLEKYREVVEFHRDVQDEVIFRVYIGDHERLPKHMLTGRLSVEQAVQRIREIADKRDMDSVMLKINPPHDGL